MRSKLGHDGQARAHGHERVPVRAAPGQAMQSGAFSCSNRWRRGVRR